MKEESQQHTGPILVVDDDTSVCILMQAALNNAGYETDIANNGIEALSKIRTIHYALIFMDCQMPEMDGYAATIKIRKLESENYNRRKSIIVAMSSSIDNTNIERCYEAGVNSFMSKPFTPLQLVQNLDSYFSRNDINEANKPIETTNTYHLSTVINQTALNNIRVLQKESQPSILDKMISLYIADSAILMQKLHQNILELDFSKIQLNSHSLKSSSATLGAIRLANLLGQFEASSHANSNLELTNLFSKLEKEYDLAVQHLESELTGKVLHDFS